MVNPHPDDCPCPECTAERRARLVVAALFDANDDRPAPGKRLHRIGGTP